MIMSPSSNETRRQTLLHHDDIAYIKSTPWDLLYNGSSSLRNMDSGMCAVYQTIHGYPDSAFSNIDRHQRPSQPIYLSTAIDRNNRVHPSHQKYGKWNCKGPPPRHKTGPSQPIRLQPQVTQSAAIIRTEKGKARKTVNDVVLVVARRRFGHYKSFAYKPWSPGYALCAGIVHTL